MAVLIIHSQYGIYLGSAGRLRFWSNTCSGQVGLAITFADEDKAKRHILQWQGHHHAVTFLPITPDYVTEDGAYATLLACLAAGAPGWLNYSTHAAGPEQ